MLTHKFLKRTLVIIKKNHSFPFQIKPLKGKFKVNLADFYFCTLGTNGLMQKKSERRVKEDPVEESDDHHSTTTLATRPSDLSNWRDEGGGKKPGLTVF